MTKKLIRADISIQIWAYFQDGKHVCGKCIFLQEDKTEYRCLASNTVICHTDSSPSPNAECQIPGSSGRKQTQPL